MKVLKNTVIIFLLLLLLPVGSSFAQKNSFVPGYVVTADMDTLHGMLKKLRSDLANGRVVFRNSYGIKTTYYPKNLHCYKIGEMMYVSKGVQRNKSVIGGPQGYMQVMDTGSVKLYFYYYDVNSETSFQKFIDPVDKPYFLSKQIVESDSAYKQSSYKSEAFIADPFRGDFYLERKGQLHQRIKTSGFKKQMAAYFEDDPLLVEELKNKSLKYADIIFLVQVYNQRAGR